jgi:hypothetical protein
MIQMLYVCTNERDYAMFFGTLQENRPAERILHEASKPIEISAR